MMEYYCQELEEKKDRARTRARAQARKKTRLNFLLFPDFVPVPVPACVSDSSACNYAAYPL